MPFPDNSFHLVVFDPPHYAKFIGYDCTLAKTYGVLLPGWQEMIRAGFSECFRVLKENGTLIFKWCAAEISLGTVLSLTPERPLFGHASGKAARTHWITFLKHTGAVAPAPEEGDNHRV